MMQTSETIGHIAEALAKAQGEMESPKKDREVEVQPKQREDKTWPQKYKFKYATFDAVLAVSKPTLSKYGIALIQTAGSSGGNVTITTRLIHGGSGEWIEETIGAAAEGRGLQALGSTLSYLKRYALTAMLGLAADEDDDGNGADGNLADVKDRTKTTASSKREVDPANVMELINHANTVEEINRTMDTYAAVVTPAIRKLAESRRSSLCAVVPAVDPDWQVWIDTFKQEINDSHSYLTAMEIWIGANKERDALRAADISTYTNLHSWFKAEVQTKSRDAV